MSDAEREWRESLQQLELLLTMVIVPVIGKYFGRKCAYWGKSIYISLEDIPREYTNKLQAGPSLCNGNIQSKSSYRVLGPSEALESSRLRRRYDRTNHPSRILFQVHLFSGVQES